MWLSRYIHKHAVVVSVLVIWPPVSVFATTVVVLRTPQRIILAADSLAYADEKAFSMCKIGTNLRFPISFAVAGFTADSQEFSSIDLAENAISGAANVHDAANRFETDAIPPFKSFIWRLRKEKPETYQKLIKSPEPLQVVFAAIESDVPIFVVVSLTATASRGDISIASHQNSCPGNSCPAGRVAEVLGENGAARKAAHDADFWRGLDPISGARELVQIEIEDRPDIVGPPISILIIEAGGIHWNNKGYCQ